MDNFKNRREKIHAQKSKAKLSQNLKKKIQTTMIGALSSIEKHFGFLWEHQDIPESKKEEMRNVFNDLRSDILDKGNHQLRNVDAELSNYEVLVDKGYHDISFVPPSILLEKHHGEGQ